MVTGDSAERFAQVVAKRMPGAALQRWWELAGGISAQTYALEVARGGQLERWVLRRPGANALARQPDLAQREFRVLEVARAAGLAAPAPYTLDDSGEIFPGPYLLMEYVDGAPDYAPADPEGAARQVAAKLQFIFGLGMAPQNQIHWALQKGVGGPQRGL